MTNEQTDLGASNNLKSYLNSFTQINLAQLISTIISSKPITCILDSISTKLLKDTLPSFKLAVIFLKSQHLILRFWQTTDQYLTFPICLKS